MKKKLIIICAALLLIISSSIVATYPTDTVTDSMTLNTNWIDGVDGPQIFSWTQTWTYTPPVVSVDAAILEIVSYDTFQDEISVEVDGVKVGYLVQGGSQEKATTVLTLNSAALAELMDASATISVSVPEGESIKIKTSTLTIDYTVPESFTDCGSGTTTQLAVGGATWQLNWGQGPWIWSESMGEPLLDPNVSAVLELGATADAEISDDLVVTFPIAGKLTLTALDENSEDGTIGTMVLSGEGVNVIDINASRVIVNEGTGMFLASFCPPGPKVMLTLDEATGVFENITQVGAWELSLAGSYAAPLIEGLELQDSILAALNEDVPLIGGIGQFALSGYYLVSP